MLYILDIHRSAFNKEGFFSFDVVGEDRLGDLPSCPSCGATVGDKPWMPPHVVRLDGKRAGDLCYGGFGDQLLVSPPFCSAWREAGLSGVSFSEDPVTIRPKMQAEYFVASPGYVLAPIKAHSPGTSIDEFLGCEDCGVCGLGSVSGVPLDLKNWKGEDLFYPSGIAGIMMATEKVVQMVNSRGLTNVFFIPEDEYRR